MGDVTWVCTFGWEADHIVPIVDGGALTIDNVQTLCATCHRAKTAREATARALRRRLAASLASGQQALFGEELPCR